MTTSQTCAAVFVALCVYCIIAGAAVCAISVMAAWALEGFPTG